MSIFSKGLIRDACWIDFTAKSAPLYLPANSLVHVPMRSWSSLALSPMLAHRLGDMINLTKETPDKSSFRFLTTTIENHKNRSEWALSNNILFP